VLSQPALETLPCYQRKVVVVMGRGEVVINNIIEENRECNGMKGYVQQSQFLIIELN